MNVKVEFENPMYPKVTKVVIKKLGRSKVWGQAFHETGIIEIDPRCVGRKHLEIITHEATHIIMPYLTEEAVSKYAAELTRVLWEQGYRKSDNDASIKLQDEEE